MSTDVTLSRRHRAVLIVLAGVAVLAATAVRVAPLVEGGDRLRWQCVSEDGYLMLTIARNFALGHGFSVSNGEIPSNGTQPLSALLYAVCYFLADADKLSSLYFVVGSQFLVAVATALLLYVVTRRCLYKGPASAAVALTAAVLWYVSPTSIAHGQNGLETGLYALCILASIGAYDLTAPRLFAGFSAGTSILLGMLLGITFLMRNDACFLIAVLLLVYLYRAHQRQMLGRAIGQALLIGATSVAVASPWLWFNFSRFGHVVPISGRAEAMHIDFAHNFWAAFVAMVENAALVIRIPHSLEQSRIVAYACFTIVSVILALVILNRRFLAQRLSAGACVLGLFVVALFIYYALFFGMPSFLGRYFFPVVLISAVFAAWLFVSALGQDRSWLLRNGAVAASALACLACMVMHVRTYQRGEQHLHAQVVDWVAKNVDDDVWVGAVQTGTLGYYHDRTINLDGKVDPFALAARQENRIYDYVIERSVEYIVDWEGIAQWAERPEFSVNYELQVHEPGRNLAVLRRRSSQASLAPVSPERAP